MGKEQLIGTKSTVKITFTDTGVRHKGTDEVSGDDFSGTKTSTNGCIFIPVLSVFETYPFLLPSLIFIGILLVFVIIYVIVNAYKKKKARELRTIEKRYPPIPTHTDNPSDQPFSIEFTSSVPSVPSFPLYNQSFTAMDSSMPSIDSSLPKMSNDPFSSQLLLEIPNPHPSTMPTTCSPLTDAFPNTTTPAVNMPPSLSTVPLPSSHPTV